MPDLQGAHTPTPWRWEFVSTAGQWMLLGAGDAFVEVGGPPDIELSPDQTLIAAAPELLEALERTHNRFRCVAGASDDDCIACNAIKKAWGE